MIIATGLFADLLLHINVTDDILLCAIFGGIAGNFFMKKK